MQRNRKMPHGGTALLKNKLRDGVRLLHPKPLTGPVLPYKELRDPAKYNTRREATEGKRIHAPRPLPEMDLRKLNGRPPGKGKSPGNKYAHMTWQQSQPVRNVSS